MLRTHSRPANQPTNKQIHYYSIPVKPIWCVYDQKRGRGGRRVLREEAGKRRERRESRQEWQEAKTRITSFKTPDMRPGF